jgi:hypothetical protein
MIKSKIVRAKTLAYSNVYDAEPSVSDYYNTSFAQTNLPIVDGGFYEVLIDLRAVWNVGGKREIYNAGSFVAAIDTFSSTGSQDCGVHKYYIKRNGATISSVAHPDNPVIELGIFYPGKNATTYGSAPNVVVVPGVYMEGKIKGSLVFTFDLDNNNLKIITPAMVTIDVGSVSNTLYFNEDGPAVGNGDYYKISNQSECSLIVYTRIRLNKVTQ